MGSEMCIRDRPAALDADSGLDGEGGCVEGSGSGAWRRTGERDHRFGRGRGMAAWFALFAPPLDPRRASALRSLRASVARGSYGASSNSVRSLFQRRLSAANNFQKALITSLLAWVALGVWSYLIVVPILSVVAFLWLGVTGWLVWRIWRKPVG